jgi:transcription elongation factor GreA-like protein
MNVEIVDRLIEKDPSLESSRSALEAMKEGASCIHRAWGVGKITGFEGDRGMIVVDFEDGERKSHAMDPVFCLDKLEILDDDHIISRHRNSPEEIDAKVEKRTRRACSLKSLLNSKMDVRATRELETNHQSSSGCSQRGKNGGPPRKNS